MKNNKEKELTIKEVFKVIEEISETSRDFEEYKYAIDAFVSERLSNNPELTTFIYKCLKESLKEFLNSIKTPIEIEEKYQRKHNTNNIEVH